MVRSLSSCYGGTLPVAVLVGCCMGLNGFSANAQNIPDAGRILQESKPGVAPPPTTGSIIQNQARAPISKAEGGGDARVRVDRFDFSGNTAISTEELRTSLAAFDGKELNFGELTQAIETVEAHYKQAGYFLVQAYLPPQKIHDGVVEIGITEGRLGETRLEGESHVSADVVFAYLDKLPRNQPLTLAVLERQILLINELSGGQASLDLQAGDAAGTTDVVLVQKSEDSVSTLIEANNYGLPSTGENRVSATLNLNGLFNRGERITLNALSSDNAGLGTYSVKGDFPYGVNGAHLTAAKTRAQYSLGGAFASLQASGTADSLHFGASYPLIRSRAKNLRVQVDADQSNLRDEFQTSNTVLDKQSQGVTASISYDWVDETGGGSSSKVDYSVRSANLSLGTAAAKQDAPPSGLGTAGDFMKMNLTLQRQQSLDKDWSVSGLLMAQVASKNLDSSEKLSLGGPTSIAGYASGEANADSGYQLKVTVRRQYSAQVSLSGFVDYSELQLSVNPLANTNNTKRLSDVGFGVDWQMSKHASVNALMAWAIDEAPNQTDNKQPRIWVNAGYLF